MVVGVNVGPLVSNDICHFAREKEERLMSLAEKDWVFVAYEVKVVLVCAG